MYLALRDLVARLLRAPTEPPRVPDGAYSHVEVLRASPRYLRYRLIGFYIGCAFTVLVLGAVLVATLVAGKPWGAAVVLFMGLVAGVFLGLAWFVVRIDYDLRFYVITERSLRVREGAWSVAEMTLTFANVQNVRIDQGPLQRLFRIQDLVVETAGGGAAHPGRGVASGHQVTLAGLENAPEVRDRILAHVKRHARSSGLGDHDDPGELARNGAAIAGGFAATPVVVAALAEVRESARRLRAAAEARAP